MNCLVFALRFWSRNPEYKIYYDGSHCVNADMPIGGKFLPAEKFGLLHFLGAFQDHLSEEDKSTLIRYFDIER